MARTKVAVLPKPSGGNDACLHSLRFSEASDKMLVFSRCRHHTTLQNDAFPNHLPHRMLVHRPNSPASVRQALADQLEAKGEGLGTIHLDDAYNLYLMDEQADLYLETISSAPFERQLYRPLISLLQEHAEQILDVPADTLVDFIDLGPGLPDKTLPLVDYLDKYFPNFRYIAVDISPRFLAITQAYFQHRRFPIIPLNLLFEEVPDALREDNRFSEPRLRIVNIGFTFNNYSPNVILPLMGRIMRSDGIGIFATEIVNAECLGDVLEPYRTNEAADFNFRMLHLVGLQIKDFDYRVGFSDQRITMGFTARRTVPLPLTELEIREGMHIQTSFSYRYRSENVLEQVSSAFGDVRTFTTARRSIHTFRVKGGL